MSLKHVLYASDSFIQKYYEGVTDVTYDRFAEIVRDRKNSTLTNGKYVATVYFNGTTLFVIYEKRLHGEANVKDHIDFLSHLIAMYKPKFVAYHRKGKMKISNLRKIREVEQPLKEVQNG